MKVMSAILIILSKIRLTFGKGGEQVRPGRGFCEFEKLLHFGTLFFGAGKIYQKFGQQFFAIPH